MRRLCERPGCGAPAAVSYGIDHASLVVWIDNRAVFERELAGRLCRRHAEALVVPRGWTLDDRREPVPKLFVTKDVPAPAAEKAARRGATRRHEHDEPPPQLPWDEIDTAIDTTVTTAVDTTVDVRPDGHETADEPSSDETAAVGRPGTDQEIDPDETRAVPWSPRLVPVEPDDPSGPVFGRLLGRAFGARSREGGNARDEQNRDHDRGRGDEAADGV